jgi:hypothetical protein
MLGLFLCSVAPLVEEGIEEDQKEGNQAAKIWLM